MRDCLFDIIYDNLRLSNRRARFSGIMSGRAQFVSLIIQYPCAIQRKQPRDCLLDVDNLRLSSRHARFSGIMSGSAQWSGYAIKVLKEPYRPAPNANGLSEHSLLAEMVC